MSRSRGDGAPHRSLMTVRHNVAHGRYEIDTRHGLAVAIYHQSGDRVVFTHTEVPIADQGHGVGSELVRAALEDTRRRGFKITPACSFVADYIRRHPEFDDAR